MAGDLLTSSVSCIQKRFYQNAGFNFVYKVNSLGFCPAGLNFGQVWAQVGTLDRSSVGQKDL